jgi:hypothetical protein
VTRVIGLAVRKYKAKSILVNYGELFGIDPRSLAALRIAVGILIIADLIIRATDLGAHYTDEGLVPREAQIKFTGKWIFCFHLLNGTWQYQAGLFLSAGALAVCMTVGYRTQLMTFLSWVFLTSLQNRNLVLPQGGDDLLRMLVFWGIFLPWGSCFSVDSKSKENPLKDPVICIAGIAYMVQVFFLYLFAFLHKSGPEWINGTAVYYALSMESITRPIGSKVLEYATLLKPMTIAVYLFEGLIPILLFLPLLVPYIRIGLFFALMVMHLSFGALIMLGLFPFISIAAGIGFLPGMLWDRLGWKLTNETQDSVAKARFLPFRPNQDTFVILSLITISIWCVGNWKNKTGTFPQPFRAFTQVFRLSQRWAMFSPGPRKSDGWLVAPAALGSGETVDLITLRDRVNWTKPQHINRRHKNYRWRKITQRMTDRSYSAYRPYYLDYLKRLWNKSNTPERAVVHAKLYYMRRWTPPPGEPTSIKKILLYSDQPEEAQDLPEKSKKSEPGDNVPDKAESFEGKTTGKDNNPKLETELLESTPK